MIQLSNTAALTLAPGETATFNLVLYNSANNNGCKANEFFMLGTGGVSVVPGTYEVSFAANLGATAATTAVQVAIAYNGTAIAGGTIETSPGAAIGDPNAVYRSRVVKVPCAMRGATFSIINPSDTVTVVIEPGSVFSVRRLG